MYREKVYELLTVGRGVTSEIRPNTHKFVAGLCPGGKFGFEGRFEWSSSENLFWHRTQRTENILVGGLVVVSRTNHAPPNHSNTPSRVPALRMCNVLPVYTAA